MCFSKKHVSDVLKRNNTLDNSVTRTAYRVAYVILYPLYFAQYLVKLTRLSIRTLRGK